MSIDRPLKCFECGMHPFHIFFSCFFVRQIVFKFEIPNTYRDERIEFIYVFRNE